MKTQLQILGVIFMSVGAFVGLFILFALVLGILAAVGLVQGEWGDVVSAITLFVVLTYPAIWITQTGLAIFYRRRSARVPGIALSLVLFLLLNVILLLTKDQPTRTGKGLLTFHVLMILIGIYGLVLLVPARLHKVLK